MQIFLFTICYFLLVALSVLLFIYVLKNLLPQIRKETQRIKNLDKQIYKDLREVQFKSRELGTLAQKLNKQKNSLVAEIAQSLIVTLMPFKKIKGIMLIYSFLKKAFAK